MYWSELSDRQKSAFIGLVDEILEGKKEADIQDLEEILEEKE